MLEHVPALQELHDDVGRAIGFEEVEDLHDRRHAMALAVDAVAENVDAHFSYIARRQVRSISHWSPYDRVGVVNADP